MIEVSITTNDGQLELAKVEIERVGGDLEHGNYSVRFAVNRGKTWFGLHQRGFDRFPRTTYNVLGLLAQALQTLEPKELELEDEVGAADMEREERGTLPALPGKEERRVHHHRSSFWRR